MGTSPYFNFASLIALLAALAFSLPFVVRLAEMFGIDRSFGIFVTLATMIVALAFVVVRNRVRHKERILARIAQIKTQIEKKPQELTSYSYQSDHLADLYLTLGKNQEALVAFREYLAVLEPLVESTESTEEAKDASEDLKSIHLKEKERVILAIERLTQDL